MILTRLPSVTTVLHQTWCAAGKCSYRELLQVEGQDLFVLIEEITEDKGKRYQLSQD